MTQRPPGRSLPEGQRCHPAGRRNEAAVPSTASVPAMTLRLRWAPARSPGRTQTKVPLIAGFPIYLQNNQASHAGDNGPMLLLTYKTLTYSKVKNAT